MNHEWEQEFRDELEVVLDEHFPKIEEEGEAKRLNKRGAALMLYSEAVFLARKAVATERERWNDCACQEKWTFGVVHRKDNPCYWPPNTDAVAAIEKAGVASPNRRP